MNLTVSLQPIKEADLRLALHVANTAARNEFPLDRPISQRGAYDEVTGETYVLNPDHVVSRITCALMDAFKNNPDRYAIAFRLFALAEAACDKDFSKWIWNSHETGDVECDDVVFPIAASYPLTKKNGHFRKGFLQKLKTQGVLCQLWQGRIWSRITAALTA